jgi:hypothetical protein
MFDFRDCDKCDVCEERNTREGGEWFKKITEKYLTVVDEAFQNDLEASVRTLANRVCATEGIRTTPGHAEEVIEYLAIAGYLFLDISFRGKGFVTMVRPVSKEFNSETSISCFSLAVYGIQHLQTHSHSI